MHDVALHFDATSNAGWYLAQQAGELAEIETWFYSNMAVLGDYCGTDSAGQRFKAAFQPKVDSINDAIPQIVQQLYGLGTTLDSWTEQSAHDDATGAQAMRPSSRGSGHGRPH